MTVEELISLLQKCNPKAHVLMFRDRRNCILEFVEHQLTTNSVLFLGDEPDWKEEEEADCIKITVLNHEPGFAEITWEDA